ncbi:MAG: autoinducer binding domain-containing protein [Alphaproteobacteria bacterium]|nr:autoinducer binding domain-containing protein [Alphaproteobacteria bacterium]
MPGLSLVEDFVVAADGARSVAELSRLTREAVRELGFDYFAVVHHVTFGRPTPDYVGLHAYPQEWVAAVRDMGRPPDPVQRAAERTGCGFRWDAIGSIVALKPCERAFMEQAARHDIADGFTVPSHVPGEAPGSSNFAVRAGRAVPGRNLPAAQALGNFAFEAARRLNRAGKGEWLAPLALSERQRECVLLIARGLSDAAMARRLGLKPRTVNEHVEAAKRRYAVTTRTQLVANALLRGEIAFSDMIGTAG